jgi:transcriptional regulator with XRE-family HTH domain
MQTNKAIFAKKLSQTMMERKMTLTELAVKTGISKSSLSMYMNGDNIPRDEYLTRLAKALEVDEDWLTEEQEEKKNLFNLKVEDAARLMGRSGQYVRIGLQRGILPFGTAIKMGSKWTYYISPHRFREYTGITPPNYKELSETTELKNA